MCLAAGYTFNSTPSLCLGTMHNYNIPVLYFIFKVTIINKKFSDIDECLTNNSICAGYGPNALCINTNGSYECGCADGYRLNNGVHCDSKYNIPTYMIV